MDTRGVAISLLSVLFLALAFGTTTGLFQLSLQEGTPGATRVVLASLGILGLLYVVKGRKGTRHR